MEVTINNERKELSVGTTYYDISKNYELECGKRPYLVKAEGVVKELRREVKDGENIEFLFYDNEVVKNAYARTATFIMLKAFNDVLGKNVTSGLKFKLRNAYYFETDKKNITDEEFEKLKEAFDSIVKKEIIIKKVTMPKSDALEVLEQENLEDVKLLFTYNYKPKIKLRFIDDYIRYINGELLYHTGFIKYYKIEKYYHGLILALSSTDDEKEIDVSGLGEKSFNTFNESIDWASKLGINTVGKLNRTIAKHKFDDLIIMTESFQDKMIGDISEAIIKSKKKIVFIAGPSSSGKTSFSYRLMYHLRALDVTPHPIACDNFFKERDETPRDENGEFNFEVIDAMDTKLLNEKLNDLLDGKETELPKFNFVLGKKEYRGDKLRLNDNSVVILEGIHCLNPALTPYIDHDKIFKIYISAITEVSIDNANRIATSDLRLIRRIVRDSRTRGSSAKETLKRWQSVRNGEANSIFPYQENADIMFNSALIYEFSVLKNQALALLFDLSEDEEVGVIARRLIKVLNYFLGVETDAIPRYSIIREFIGSSIMEVD